MKLSPCARCARAFGGAESVRLGKSGTRPPSGPTHARRRPLYFAFTALLFDDCRFGDVDMKSFPKSPTAPAKRRGGLSGPGTHLSAISLRTWAADAVLCPQCAECSPSFRTTGSPSILSAVAKPGHLDALPTSRTSAGSYARQVSFGNGKRNLQQQASAHHGMSGGGGWGGRNGHLRMWLGVA